MSSWRWWHRGTDPASVAGGPLAVGSHLCQHSIDETHKVWVLPRNRQAVWLITQARSDDLGMGILGREPGQDRVIGRDRGDIALLQQNQAICPVRHGDRDADTCLGCTLAEASLDKRQ